MSTPRKRMAPRVLFPSTPAKVRRLERQIKAARPEMQSKTVTFSAAVPARSGATSGITQADLTNINHGDGISERSGNRIRVWRIEIRGIMSPDLDGHIIQKHGTTALDGDKFNAQIGGFLTDAVQNTEFTQWKHFTTYQTNSGENIRFRAVQKFRGLQVKYVNTTGAPVDNGLLVAFTNYNTTSKNVNCTMRIWYTNV